ncbi:teichoic acid export ATP-binding protein TagH [Flavobacteriaceae bacterium UJ101]|nr:teichoic acid export ATP-binding protein TagH [Flavobacteriaceae bacterium UJ101]
MIQVQNVSKSFQLSKKERKIRQTNEAEIFAVKEVNIQCHPGRIFSILGPNGAGKTTLLRMIATMITPTSGEIEVAGYNTITDHLEVRKRIGFLTGSTGLYERFSADELMDYLKNIYQIPKDQFRFQKGYLFDLLGIHEFSTKKIGQLSVGMKQKVSIARTLIHNPEVIILDEPTSGLDVITAKNIIELIRNSKDEGKTVIFSSHIMSEVDLLCDDLAIMNKGTIVFNDTMDSFRTQMKTSNLTEEFIHIIEEHSKA